MHSHSLPLLAVLWLPATLFLLSRVTLLAARHGWPGAARLMSGWRTLDMPTRAALILMAVTAAVHVALIPAHLGDRVTATLFALDALGLSAVGVAGLLGVPWWRVAAATLLLGAVGAYGAYVAAGREVLDLTGLATKVDELAAVELLVVGRLVGPQRLRLTRAPAALLGGGDVPAELRDAG